MSKLRNVAASAFALVALTGMQECPTDDNTTVIAPGEIILDSSKTSPFGNEGNVVLTGNMHNGVITLRSYAEQNLMVIKTIDLSHEGCAGITNPDWGVLSDDGRYAMVACSYWPEAGDYKAQVAMHVNLQNGYTTQVAVDIEPYGDFWVEKVGYADGTFYPINRLVWGTNDDGDVITDTFVYAKYDDGSHRCTKTLDGGYAYERLDLTAHPTQSGLLLQAGGKHQRLGPDCEVETHQNDGPAPFSHMVTTTNGIVAGQTSPSSWMGFVSAEFNESDVLTTGIEYDLDAMMRDHVAIDNDRTVFIDETGFMALTDVTNGGTNELQINVVDSSLLSLGWLLDERGYGNILVANGETLEIVHFD